MKWIFLWITPQTQDHLTWRSVDQWFLTVLILYRAISWWVSNNGNDRTMTVRSNMLCGSTSSFTYLHEIKFHSGLTRSKSTVFWRWSVSLPSSLRHVSSLETATWNKHHGKLGFKTCVATIFYGAPFLQIYHYRKTANVPQQAKRNTIKVENTLKTKQFIKTCNMAGLVSNHNQ
jgi:hypothetical protein